MKKIILTYIYEKSLKYDILYIQTHLDIFINIFAYIQLTMTNQKLSLDMGRVTIFQWNKDIDRNKNTKYTYT